MQALIQSAASDPKQMEQLYRDARNAGKTNDFQSAVLALVAENPDNLLLEAWYHRLLPGEETADASNRRVNWLAAVPLSILTGLIFWALSDFENSLVANQVPQLIFWWSPIASMAALIFLSLSGRSKMSRALALGVGLLAAAGYAVLLAPGLGPEWKTDQFLIIAAIHIPLLCWAGLGVFILGRKSSVADRMAFLIKSVEVMITAGLYLIFGMVFGGITIGMFAALNIDLPEIWLRLIAAGGAGLLPVLALASVYDPEKTPSQQNFEQGLSRFIAMMMRLLLPLTLVVLGIYILVIPFNFLAPFESRDVLIVFNLMLFGIMGLLLGATPIQGKDISPRVQGLLRSGILAVAILAGLVSVYALAAIVYRTIDGGWTINRLTIIGWNSINIGILIAVIYGQFKGGREAWIASMQKVFSRAMIVYLAWGLILVLLIPLLF